MNQNNLPDSSIELANVFSSLNDGRITLAYSIALLRDLKDKSIRTMT